MRVPLRWLGESVDLPEDATLEHVHAALVSVGFEEETVHTYDLTGPVVVGRVLSLEPEPQKRTTSPAVPPTADRMSWRASSRSRVVWRPVPDDSVWVLA